MSCQFRCISWWGRDEKSTLIRFLGFLLMNGYMMKFSKLVGWSCAYMCCYDWIDVGMIMNMHVWGFSINECVKAWVLFMIMMKFVVEFNNEIVINFGGISDVYVNDYAIMINC